MSASRAVSRGLGTAALGQLLLIGVEENRWTSALERRLRAWQPAGVFFTAGNLRSPGAAAELLGKIARVLDIPPFLSIAEEGEEGNLLRKFFPPLPSFGAAAQKSFRAVERLGGLTGAALQLLGFNTSLAPSLDLAEFPSGIGAGTRSPSADAGELTRCAGAYLGGLKRNGILACGKHFPGLSEGKLDRHSGLAVIAKPMAAMWREDLLPYRRLANRLPLVMLSHAAYKAYDFDLLQPATVSLNVLEGLLRVKLGYRGVAVSADLASESMRRVLAPEKAAVQAVAAGCDLVFVGGEESVDDVFASLAGALASGAITTERVDEALGGMRASKRRLPRPSGKISRSAFDKLAGKFDVFAQECATRERTIA